MNSSQTSALDNATDAADIEQGNQVAAKTYTQDEVDNMMARMKGSLEKKLLKPYADLGDPEELRQLRTEAERRQQEQQIKRGEFEKTLQELAAKKDAEISKRDGIIQEYRVNTPILNAAAKFRAVNPEQVRTLLSPQLRLNADGEVEVLDNSGSVRYNDAGQPIGVDDLVREFLDSNPHFVSAAPATTNTQSSVGTRSNTSSIDLTQLDMKRPEHRKLYAEARKAGRV